MLPGCPGKNGAKWDFTPILPTPGPPPPEKQRGILVIFVIYEFIESEYKIYIPWGIQNVLCKLRWHTSAPICPGEVNATWAFIFAPSI